MFAKIYQVFIVSGRQDYLLLQVSSIRSKVKRPCSVIRVCNLLKHFLFRITTLHVLVITTVTSSPVKMMCQIKKFILCSHRKYDFIATNFIFFRDIDGKVEHIGCRLIEMTRILIDKSVILYQLSERVLLYVVVCAIMCVVMTLSIQASHNEQQIFRAKMLLNFPLQLDQLQGVTSPLLSPQTLPASARTYFQSFSF